MLMPTRYPWERSFPTLTILDIMNCLSSLLVFINVRIVCLSVFVFFERLVGPFSTKMDSLDSFQRCADSDGHLFLSVFLFLLLIRYR